MEEAKKIQKILSHLKVIGKRLQMLENCILAVNYNQRSPSGEMVTISNLNKDQIMDELIKSIQEFEEAEKELGVGDE